MWYIRSEVLNMINPDSKIGKVIKTADKFIGLFCDLSPYIFIVIMLLGMANNNNRFQKDIEMLKKQNQELKQQVQNHLPASNQEVSSK